MRTCVMVAEGDPTLADVVTETFASNEYEVKLTPTFESAVTELERSAPDVLLVADDLSGGRGLELCRKARQAAGQNRAPAIVFLTREPGIKQPSGLTSCVDLWLRRPVDPIELESAVERLLQRKRRNDPANPLTKLPGPAALKREIDRRRDAAESYSVCVFRFAAVPMTVFRKKHGELRYTAMLKQAARTVLGCAVAVGGKDAFVAHCGTADRPELVAVVGQAGSKELCEAVCEEFAAAAELLHEARERQDGYMVVPGETGDMSRVPLVTLESETSNETAQAQSSGSSSRPGASSE
ncbi:MAG: response regulator transcription factor [Candidatus Eisenbacteria bacterium]|nr:response regulator transcription factor [Candidatus Eisenbacteria bacterium]